MIHDLTLTLDEHTPVFPGNARQEIAQAAVVVVEVVVAPGPGPIVVVEGIGAPQAPRCSPPVVGCVTAPSSLSELYFMA